MIIYKLEVKSFALEIARRQFSRGIGIAQDLRWLMDGMGVWVGEGFRIYKVEENFSLKFKLGLLFFRVVTEESRDF